MIANLIAAQYGTVSDIEIVWTLIALFGASFALYNWREASADLRALKVAGTKNGRLLLASTNRVMESIRVVVQTIFLTIGLLAMTIPDRPDARLDNRIEITAFLIRWGIITASGLIAFKSFLAFRLRNELKESYGDPQDPDSPDRDIDELSFDQEQDARDLRQDKRDVRQEERDERQAKNERIS